VPFALIVYRRIEAKKKKKRKTYRSVLIDQKLPVLEKGREISINFDKFRWKFQKVAKNFNKYNGISTPVAMRH
jgi:hypothetical protein